MLAKDPREWLCSALGLELAQSPFPWQEDLLERMLQNELPDALDIPTGLGKTSVMAIWLVARACGANLPRRLVYVVDRRAVVDQATDVAIGLRGWIEQNADLKTVLGLEDRPLPISTLRGQYVDNREWLADPSAPAIIVGTVDMIGSRLLFEGYGVSRKMRPYHAGLLGVDTLLVLDEAHLTPPFEHLLRAIATDPIFRPRDEKCDAQVPRFKLLTLSATGRAQGSNTLRLTEKDFRHPILATRLNAKKALRLHPFDKNTKLEDALAKHAWALAGDGRQPVHVIVYLDSREIAQKAREAIEKLAKGDRKEGRPAVKIDMELFAGSRRVFEREEAKKRLEELGFLAGRKTERTSPAFLFATSAGEVGVDLDADHMVCDLVAWERMVQRLGRVNRRGEPDGHVANVVVLVAPEPQPDKKTQEALDKRSRNERLAEKEICRVEGHERKVQEWKNWQRPFKNLPSLEDGSFDASVRALVALRERARKEPELERVLQEATSPEPLRPALHLPLVEAWSLTSLKQHPGRPVVQPWLRGWVDDPPQTAIIWRTYLPIRKGGLAPRKAEIEAFFEAAPVHTSEVLETETFRAADWILALVKKTGNERADQNSSEQWVRLCDEDVVAFVLNTDGTLRKQFRLRCLKALQDKEKALQDKEKFKEALGGATLIVDARLGGLKDGLLDDSAAEPPLTADGSDWLGEGVVGFRVRSTESPEARQRNANWCERYRFACEVNEDGEPIRWLVVDKWRDDAATEDDRSEGVIQLLEEHQQRVEQRARELAKALGFSQDLEEILALAARLHDEGKCARRWQRAFNAPKNGIYAKTEGPIYRGLLNGYRHELGSVRRIREDQRLCNLSDEQRDLVLHLIAAHHGFARPMIPTDGCEDAPPSALNEIATEIALRFARLQKQWGPWGLAWWEALLRASDQLASRDHAAVNGSAGVM
jgi:CRISPR-associated endonuclease/helicase Cas3